MSKKNSNVILKNRFKDHDELSNIYLNFRDTAFIQNIKNIESKFLIDL